MDKPATAVLVTTYAGQASSDELRRLAAVGQRPRREYVRLAEELPGAVIVDHAYLRAHGHPLARLLARASVPVAQVAEAFLRRRRFPRVVALSDRTGLPLALLLKLARSRRDVILVADWVTPPKKAVFLRHLAVHSHLRAIVQTNTLQQARTRDVLGVPASKLVLLPWAVDTRFWAPVERPPDDLVCAVGWEQRDYATFLEAARCLPVDVHLAVGTMVFSPPAEAGAAPATAGRRVRLEQFAALRPTAGYRRQARWLAGAGGAPLPEGVVVHTQLAPLALRDLYARSRFVVLPLHEVDFDAGATAVTEAMAMGKAVVLSGIAGQTDYVRHGVEGLYVRPYDAPALRRAIDYLLEHPEVAERMGRAGRRRAEALFSIDDFARRLGELVTVRRASSQRGGAGG